MASELITVEELLRLGDLELVQDGNHGGNYPKVEEFCDFGIPLITGACLDSGRIDFSKAGFISEERASRLRVGFSRTGDVLLTHKGTMGKTALVQKSQFPYLILNPQITLYRVSSKGRLNSRFLKYYFDSKIFQDYLIQISSTSTISTLSITEQKKLKIPLPSPVEQSRIVEVLGALDDKIALLRETNATLEAIAQALFKSWFVDFDPVLAKAEGRDPEGVPPEVENLFPSEFEGSELGEIPKGWKVECIGDAITRIGVGKKFDQKTALAEGSVPILDQSKDGYFGYHNENPGVEASSGNPICVFTNHTCNMRLINFPFSTIQNVLPFRGKSHATEWTYFATRNRQQFVEYKGHWVDFVTIKILLPSAGLAGAFASEIQPLLRQIWTNENQQSVLIQLRDTLLPRLMSGKVRIPGEAT